MRCAVEGQPTSKSPTPHVHTYFSLPPAKRPRQQILERRRLEGSELYQLRDTTMSSSADRTGVDEPRLPTQRTLRQGQTVQV